MGLPSLPSDSVTNFVALKACTYYFIFVWPISPIWGSLDDQVQKRGSAVLRLYILVAAVEWRGNSAAYSYPLSHSLSTQANGIESSPPRFIA